MPMPILIDRRTTLALTGALAFLIATASPGGAIPGDLDATFSGDGKVTVDFGGNFDGVTALAIQHDGRIVAVGSALSWDRPEEAQFAVARFNSDGLLDATFDADGTVVTDFGGSAAQATAMAIQTDGKIVAAGFSGVSGVRTDFALARYNPDGSLDATFDGDGRVTTDFPSNDDIAFAVAIQSDGKIVAAGLSRGSHLFDFAVARYNSDGSLDDTFGGDGRVTTDFEGDLDIAADLAIQTDGKIVAAGYADTPGLDFALARYDPDGSLDATFGGDGKVTTDFSTEFSKTGDVAQEAMIQEDGKIIAAGYIIRSRNIGGTITSDFDFALARYNADGSPDNDFEHDGTVTTDLGGGDTAHGMAIQRDGKIVTAGTTNVSGTYDFALARYTADGTVDATFGGGSGMVTTDFAGSPDWAESVTFQRDGKIVAAGSAGGDFALARYTVCRRTSRPLNSCR
jgi:uncharacterized delta-60 repeat protein